MKYRENISRVLLSTQIHTSWHKFYTAVQDGPNVSLGGIGIDVMLAL